MDLFPYIQTNRFMLARNDEMWFRVTPIVLQPDSSDGTLVQF
jgi:hypothetical protein